MPISTKTDCGNGLDDDNDGDIDCDDSDCANEASCQGSGGTETTMQTSKMTTTTVLLIV